MLHSRQMSRLTAEAGTWRKLKEVFSLQLLEDQPGYQPQLGPWPLYIQWVPKKANC